MLDNLLHTIRLRWVKYQLARNAELKTNLLAGYKAEIQRVEESDKELMRQLEDLQLGNVKW